jgi:hypothetical protein
VKAAIRVGLVAISLVGWATRAAAQDEDAAAAESLFASGEAALARGEEAIACDRFRESQRLLPRPSTLEAVAGCFERQGKVATAWAQLREARRLAEARGEGAHAEALGARLAKLEPRVPHMRIIVDVRGVEPVVERDGKVIAPARWGLWEAVDPGVHTLTIQLANGDTHASITNAVRVKVGEGDSAEVVLPPGKRSPLADPTVQHTLGYVLMGVGAAAMVTGVVLVVAGTNNPAVDCGPHPTDACLADTSGPSDQQTKATVGAFAIGAGVGAAALGLYLALSDGSTPATTTAPVALPHGGGLALTSAF